MTKKIIRCPRCESLKTKRRGKRQNKDVSVQLVYCFDCRKTFTAGKELKKERYRASPS